MRQAVLLLAHGAPERVEDVEPFLALIRGGRPATPAVVEEVKRRYAAIGGSPFSARTMEQAAALQSLLDVRVYVGMRNWRPSIRETLARMQSDGVERIVAICLAPQYSDLSVGLYFRRAQEAKMDLGLAAEIVWTRSFHDHPLLIEAFCEKLAPLLPCQKVLFTAHSLPEKYLEATDPYAAEARATAGAVAGRAGLGDWDFAYQSQGMTDDKWLGPSVESVIDGYARQGIKELVLAPIGFVCDHVEILYDVDIQFQRHAGERGIRLQRPESLNASPKFISALAAVAGDKLAET
jgi:ferrochelatase